MTTLLIGEQDGNCKKSSTETCYILRPRRLHHGKMPLGNASHGGGIPRKYDYDEQLMMFFFFFSIFLSVHAE